MVAKFVTSWPFTVIFPVLISCSAWRRDAMPACARYLANLKLLPSLNACYLSDRLAHPDENYGLILAFYKIFIYPLSPASPSRSIFLVVSSHNKDSLLDKMKLADCKTISVIIKKSIRLIDFGG
jgi:hypothetical protein